MSKKLNIAVIGAGYLGNFHSEKYSQHPSAQLVSVVDIQEERAKEIAAKYNTSYTTDYRTLLESKKVDAVSIVTPTDTHYEIARAFLEAGIDVLIEKPITHKIWQAEELVRLAQDKGRILQVGHLERFNSAIQKLSTILTKPLFIECHRLHSFVQRGTEVDVILDLMIHDLDIILSMVRSDLSKINAVGVAVLSSLIDIANVRLEFQSGCVANITASRVSLKSMRKIRLFQPDCYVSVDFQKATIEIYKKTFQEGDSVPELSAETLSLERKDALREEINAFIDSVQSRTKPLVSGLEALDALKLAHQIVEHIQQKTPKSTSHSSVGVVGSPAVFHG